MKLHDCDGWCATCIGEAPEDVTTRHGHCEVCGCTEDDCECAPELGSCVECRRPIFEGDTWQADCEGDHWCQACWPGEVRA